MENNDVPYIPNLIQIGSTGRNSGKTTLAINLIQSLKSEKPVYSIKIITITGEKGICQRGGLGCGICTNFTGEFDLTEEKKIKGSKDTCRMLNAGSKKTFLLKAMEEHLLAGFWTFYQLVPQNAWVVCESNSLRKYLKPRKFIMLNNQKKAKPSAAEVMVDADLILTDETNYPMTWLN